MRRLTLLLFLLSAAAIAQTNRFPPINLYAGDPTGNACSGNLIQQSSTTGLIYTCQTGTMKVAATGGSGSGTVSGQTNGKIPLATGSTVIGAPSHLDDGLTTAATITSTEQIAAPSAAFSGNVTATTAAASVNSILSAKAAPYNVKGDGQKASMTSSTTGGVTTVTCNSCTFTTGDIGKTINVPGAGALYLGGGTLGTPTVTINVSGVVQSVTFSGASGLPINATIPLTFSTAGGFPTVTAKGYVTTDGSGVPTGNVWVGGMDYGSAPTISVGYAVSGSTVYPGQALRTTIAAMTDTHHVTLTDAATTDITAAETMVYGTDDTAALNAAVLAMLQAALKPTSPNGGFHLFLPSGIYLINGPITVNSGGALPTGWTIEGAANGSTRIDQIADNTPIFDMTQAGTWGFNYKELSFEYANAPQLPTYVNSAAIYFDSPNLVGGAFYGFNMTRLNFFNGFRGVSIAHHTSVSQSVWGYQIEDIVGGGGAAGLSGATLYLVSSPTVGNPRCSVRNIFSTQTVGEPDVSIGGSCDQLDATNLEFDSGYNYVAGFSGVNLHLNGFHCEVCAQAANQNALMDITNMNSVISGIDVHSITPNIGNALTFRVINANGHGSGTGMVQIAGTLISVDPCYLASPCTPPAHNYYVTFNSQNQRFDAGDPVILSGSGFTIGSHGAVDPSSTVIGDGALTQQNTAISLGRYLVPTTSPYQADATQANYQEFALQANLGGANSGFVNGWTGSFMNVRFIQPGAGTGPFTAGPSNVNGLVPPIFTNGVGAGTGATCTAIMNGQIVGSVACSGGTGFPLSTRIGLQFVGGTGTNLIPATGYITTDGSGNLTGAATITFNGNGYATPPTVTVGQAWTEQQFRFMNDMQQWFASSPAYNSDGSMCMSGNVCFGIPTLSSAGGIAGYYNRSLGRGMNIRFTGPGSGTCPNMELWAAGASTYQGGETWTKDSWIDCNGMYFGGVTSQTANPSTVGNIRLAAADTIAFRNNANSANIQLAKNSSDQLTWNGSPITGISGGPATLFKLAAPLSNTGSTGLTQVYSVLIPAGTMQATSHATISMGTSACTGVGAPFAACSQLSSITGISGGSGFSGSGTLFLTAFNNGCTGSTATVTITAGAFTSAAITAGGTGCTVAPTSATCTSGTATCTGSPVSITVTGTAGINVGTCTYRLFLAATNTGTDVTINSGSFVVIANHHGDLLDDIQMQSSQAAELIRWEGKWFQTNWIGVAPVIGTAAVNMALDKYFNVFVQNSAAQDSCFVDQMTGVLLP